MMMLSRVLLAGLLMSLTACGAPEDASMIPSAQATEVAPALYPPMATDAVADGHVHEYY